MTGRSERPICEECGKRVSRWEILRAFHRCLTKSQRKMVDDLETNVTMTTLAVILEGTPDEYVAAVQSLDFIAAQPLPPRTLAHVAKNKERLLSYARKMGI